MGIELNSEVFPIYAFWAGFLAIKVFVMAFLTSNQRFRKNAFASPEDCAGRKLQPNNSDPDVERVRRAHLNDLENVVPFLIIGFIYTFTNPTAATASLLFKLFAGARVVHSIVYAVYPIPQPARAIAWVVAVLIQFYMAFKIMIYFY